MSPSRVDSSAVAELAALVREIPDFPQPGVLFRDISPLLRERFDAALAAMEKSMDERRWAEIDAIAGVDARGFILAAGLAARLGKGFVPIRKTGKLPPPVERIEHQLEYGSGVLEMHRGVGRVALVDDVLATGGTMRAAAELAERSGFTVAALLVLIDLGIASQPIWRGMRAHAVLEYG
jgi:adenine phosphoribosyltransferase